MHLAFLYDVVLHTVNLLLPAFLLPLALVGLGRLASRRQALVRALWLQWLCHLPQACAVLLAGLWWSGQDGRMASYGLLVLVCGSTQWALLGGWKRR